MKYLFLLTLTVGTMLSLSACSDDDDDQKQVDTQYTDVYRIKYGNPENDSTETAIVRATYAKELMAKAADNYDSILVSGKDTTVCLQQLGQMVERADSILSLKNFSSHPYVTIYNQNDSLVFQQVYGAGENSGDQFTVDYFAICDDSNETLWEYLSTFADKFVGEIRLTYLYGWGDMTRYNQYIVKSEDLNGGTFMDRKHIYFLAADNYYTNDLSYSWKHYQMNPITDVVVYDRTASDDKELKEWIVYNGRSYKLAANPDNPYINDKGKGHEITLYYTQVRGTGKRLMMVTNYTAYGYRYVHRKWWWLTPFQNNTYMQFFKANIEDYLKTDDMQSHATTGDGIWTEVTPLVATQNGKVVKISDEANMHEGLSNVPFMHLILNYKHDSSY